jgi:F-type H+-transporting ATPase subunit epsilon
LEVFLQVSSDSALRSIATRPPQILTGFPSFVFLNSYNKYTQIASRAVRQGLKESERVAAEKRAQIGLKVQTWENGVGGEQVSSG